MRGDSIYTGDNEIELRLYLFESGVQTPKRRCSKSPPLGRRREESQGQVVGERIRASDQNVKLTRLRDALEPSQRNTEVLRQQHTGVARFTQGRINRLQCGIERSRYTSKQCFYQRPPSPC